MKTLKNTKYLLLTLFFALIILLSTLFMPKFAKADTSTDFYTFTSSNLFIPIKSFNEHRNDNLTESGIFNYSFKMDYNSTDGYFYDLSNSSLNWIEYLSGQNRTLMYTYTDLTSYSLDLSKILASYFDYEKDIYNNLTDDDDNFYGYAVDFEIFPVGERDNDNLKSSIHMFSNVRDFVPNIIKVEFGNFFSSYGSLFGPRYWNYIKYTNYTGDYFRLSWYVGNSWCIDINSDYSYAPMNSLLEYREYYLDTDFTQDVYYDNGYAQGKSDGYSDGYTIGKEEGYTNGFEQGERKGYLDGINDKTDYSFLGLFTAIIDAPIQALFGNGTSGGLFNFEFLGINLAGFYLSLFTIMIVLTIVKIVMKGG